MMVTLGANTYGKTDVRLTQVTRNGSRHEVVELSVTVLFQGDFDDSYGNADNSKVLPTDTMKNTVYVIARRRPINNIETFAGDLARHFLDRVTSLTNVKVEVLQTPWLPMEGSGTAFLRAGLELRMTTLQASHSAETFVSGIHNLEILKTGGSAFSGFMRDDLTTLPETRDRLLGTVLNAEWTYRHSAQDFEAMHAAIRKSLLKSFAEHSSESVQHTLFDMGQTVLKNFPALSGIHITMPNKHRLLVDLSKFGLDNPNQIFVPVDEPSGFIEARLSSSE